MYVFAAACSSSGFLCGSFMSAEQSKHFTMFIFMEPLHEPFVRITFNSDKA